MAARFVEVYGEVRRLADDLLRGQHPAAGMALTAREEANLRRAAALAFQQGQRAIGGGIADTLGLYLGRAGRLRERNALTAWAKAQLTAPGAGPDGGAMPLACWTIPLAGRFWIMPGRCSPREGRRRRLRKCKASSAVCKTTASATAPTRPFNWRWEWLSGTHLL